MSNKDIRKGLGGAEARILADFAMEGRTIISIEELAEKVGSGAKARRMAAGLVKKRWLKRLRRGLYLILGLEAGSTPAWTEDAYYIASKIAKQSYIGFYNMLNYYGWTEQVPLVVNVATTKVLRSRSILGVRYNFVCISKKKFFGITKRYISGHEVTVSEPEKTLVDALDHPEYCGGIEEVAKALYNAQKEIDWAKLVRYAKKTCSGAVFKRLGYLAEVMEIHLPLDLKERVRAGLTKGYAPLSPEIGGGGVHDSHWLVLVNVPLTKERVLS